MKNRKTAVLMGGFGGEREISLKSGKAVLEALKNRGYNAIGIDVGDYLIDRLKEEKVETAFIALHGPVGEDGTVQAVLEFLRIPYTGSGVAASSAAMDKVISKRVFEAVGIPTAQWELIERDEPFPKTVTRPMVIKPANGGSSLAVTIIAEDSAEAQIREAVSRAFEVCDSAIAETYIPGREITVGVLDGEPLGCVEIRPKEGFYDYEHKYTPGCSDYLAPAPLDENAASLIRSLGGKVYKALGCRGAARVDFRLPPDGGPVVLELNTIPGLTEVSLLPKSAAVVGIEFGELIERMLLNATCERKD